MLEIAGTLASRLIGDTIYYAIHNMIDATKHVQGIQTAALLVLNCRIGSGLLVHSCIGVVVRRLQLLKTHS